MKKRVIEALIGLATAITSWLALSYIFFPIKLSAPADEYFMATVTHMVPLKSVITILFIITILFLYEQKTKKNKNK
ncbi:MAG: hypothetical protein IKV25_07595 [Clostridia bacterium]|nr:hypothetical protein [Clostridia bacterium]